MKKLVSVLLVLTLLLAFAACGSTNDESSSSAPQQTSASNSAPAEESSRTNDSSASGEGAGGPNSSSTPAETGANALVVYFSWSGNTENVAKAIQSQTDSDIFEIVPATPYSDDYNTVLDVAREEQRSNARPAISGSIDNIEQYDVIYVGFPNWWGDMPMILYSFFDEYDFSGKTIIPFNTHGGSGFSGTISTIKELEPNAEVLDGKSISRNDIQDAEQEIVDWVNSLDLKQAEEQPDSSAEAQQPTMGRFLYLCRFGYE